MNCAADMEVELPAIAAINDLSDAVERAISCGDWQHAAELEAERRRQLGVYLAAATAGRAELEPVRESLRALEQRNHELIGEVQHHRRQLLFEACTLERGRRAMRAYGGAGGDTGGDTGPMPSEGENP